MNLISTLSSDEAEQALTASTKAAVQAGVAVTIAIVDAAGAMLALRRMDGAKAYTIDLASRKATTSASLGLGTLVLDTMYKGRTPPAGMMTLPGGVPVLSEGKCAGAIGVSGASPEVDEAVAQAGIAAIA